MANQKKLPLPLSFNLNLSGSSSLEDTLKNNYEQVSDVLKPHYRAPQLFIKQPAGNKHARVSVLKKCGVKSAGLPISSTPKLALAYNNNDSSEINFSPITNKTQYNNNKTFDELPPLKRLKGVNAKEKSCVYVQNENAMPENYVNDEESVSSTTSPKYYALSLRRTPKKVTEQNTTLYKQSTKMIQNKNDKVTVRETIAKAKATEDISLVNIDMIDRHEGPNSYHMTFENIDVVNHKNQIQPPLQNQIQNISHLPFHTTDKKVLVAKAAFDNLLGLSGTVISLSSQCTESFDGSQSIQTEKIEKEASKRNVSVNTSKPKPKAAPTVAKSTVSTQKNAIRDISTNTTVCRPVKNVKEVTIIEKEKSKISIGTNTTNNKNLPQEKNNTSFNEDTSKTSKNIQKHNKSPVKVDKSSGVSMVLGTSLRENLRPRTKNINYSILSNSNARPATSDDTGVSRNRSSLASRAQTTRASSKPTRKKKRTTLFPASLRRQTKSKPKSENVTQRLSGFYQMDIQKTNETQEQTLNDRRSRRPPSLFIQSHVIGPGSLKNVLLKKLSRHTAHNNTETTETARRSRRIKSTAKDDTTFKKPLPIRSLRSVRNGSISTGGTDTTEPLLSSAQIETIEEMPSDESTKSTNNTEDTDCHEIIKKKRGRPPKAKKHQVDVFSKELSSSNSCKESSMKNKDSFTHKNSLADAKTLTKDFATVTISSNDKNSVQNTSLSNRSSNQKLKSNNSSQKDISKLDAAPSSSCVLNDCIYEINDTSPLSNQSIEVEQLHSNHSHTRHLASPQKMMDKSTIDDANINTPKDAVVKPRKSVTFCEPIVPNNMILRPIVKRAVFDDEIAGTSASKNALALAERRNLPQSAIIDSADDIDNSNAEVPNKESLCTIIDNKPVLLRKWISPMPDLKDTPGNTLLNYTLKNIPHVNFILSSGCLVLGPGQKKPKHATMKQSMFFLVSNGEGIVNIQGIKCSVSAGYHFTVPLGAIYSITNTSFDKQLELFFLKFGSNSTPKS